MSSYYDEVYEKNDPAPEGSYGWIQWKGTDVCMDIRCICGHRGHIDRDFFYHYKCVSCGRKYAVGQHVRLIEMTPDLLKLYAENNKKHGFKETEPDFKVDLDSEREND